MCVVSLLQFVVSLYSLDTFVGFFACIRMAYHTLRRSRLKDSSNGITTHVREMLEVAACGWYH